MHDPVSRRHSFALHVSSALHVSRALTLVFLCLSLGACGEDAPRAPSGLDADPWVAVADDALDARIDEARREAGASGRRVLLDFVADWCTDCREVVRLSHLEPARSVIEERYVVVYVEVGRFDRHRAWIDRFGIDRIATLVVLDPESGERAAQTTLEPLTGAQRGLTSEQLAAWLRAPTLPAPPS